MRKTAAMFGVSLLTVQRWCERAGREAIERVDWTDRSSMPKRTRRVEAETERVVIILRRELKDESVLGEYGARAIRQEMVFRGAGTIPSVRTIGRILERSGELDGRRRIRRPPPPPGWYLPEVAARSTELDSFDAIEDHVLEGGSPVNVLTGISLHGGVAGAWPCSVVTADDVLDALLGHWREVGLPGYVQFDNAPLFIGMPARYRNVLSRVVRLCFCLGVVPVFVPLRETGFQASIESFNRLWAEKVWSRYFHASLDAVKSRSAAYIAAHRHKNAQRAERAPARRRFPRDWKMDIKNPPPGRIILLRRANGRGEVNVLGGSQYCSSGWPYRLVRCEVDLTEQNIRFYALRRKDPGNQPLLREIPYEFKIRTLDGVTSRH